MWSRVASSINVNGSNSSHVCVVVRKERRAQIVVFQLTVGTMKPFFCIT